MAGTVSIGEGITADTGAKIVTFCIELLRRLAQSATEELGNTAQFARSLFGNKVSVSPGTTVADDNKTIDTAVVFSQVHIDPGAVRKVNSSEQLQDILDCIPPTFVLLSNTINNRNPDLLMITCAICGAGTVAEE